MSRNIKSQSINTEIRKENILNFLIDKHFSLWGSLKSDDNINQIKNNLWKEIFEGCGSSFDNSTDHLLYEYSEFIDRQSKYVISGQRAYEYYGYSWRLPLWDEEYILFWKNTPLNIS